MRKRAGFILAVDVVVLAALAACSGSTDPSDTTSPTNKGTSSSSSGSSGPTSSSSSSGALPDGPGDGGYFPPYADQSSFTCTDPLPNIVNGLHPAQAVDYLELRMDSGVGGPVDAGGDASPYTAQPNTSVGTECSTSTCYEQLRAATAAGWGLGSGCGNAPPENNFLVYTRGDTVGTVGKTDLISFLGTIDSPEEARLVLRASAGVELYCQTGLFTTGIKANGDGSYDIIANSGACPSIRTRYTISAAGDVKVDDTLKGTDTCACGRRFDGLVESPREGSDLAGYLAECAYLEAASVIAFRRFEAELRELGAPEQFLARARRAKRDEIRHARTTARLAAVHGADARKVEAAAAQARTRFEIAMENAVEGCVRETFGALVAALQAKTAKNPAIRAAMRTIAKDEAAHAALAHDVAAWLEPQLTGAERAAIAAAKADAVAALRGAALLPRDVRVAAGLPDAAMTARLLDALPSLARAA